MKMNEHWLPWFGHMQYRLVDTCEDQSYILYVRREGRPKLTWGDSCTNRHAWEWYYKHLCIEYGVGEGNSHVKDRVAFIYLFIYVY